MSIDDHPHIIRTDRTEPLPYALVYGDKRMIMSEEDVMILYASAKKMLEELE